MQGKGQKRKRQGHIDRNVWLTRQGNDKGKCTIYERIIEQHLVFRHSAHHGEAELRLEHLFVGLHVIEKAHLGNEVRGQSRSG